MRTAVITLRSFWHYCTFVTVISSVSPQILDKDFRKEFFDVPNPVVDQLYKLFKRRPRFVILHILDFLQLN